MRRIEELRQEEAAIRAAFPELFQAGRRGRPRAAASASAAAAPAEAAAPGKRRRRRRQVQMSPAARRAVSIRMKKYGRTPQGQERMTCRAYVLAAGAVLVAASTALAQQRDPLPRFSADVRGTSVSLPTSEGWSPPVPAGVQVPARTVGLEAGAHVFVLRFRGGALGVGGTLLIARGKTSPPTIQPIPGATPPPPQPDLPDVSTRLTTWVPQVSLNFGHRNGWSYISAGIGRARVESSIIPATVLGPPVDSGWTRTISYGGGARWLIKEHVGFAVDLHWHKLAGVSAIGAPRVSLMGAGAGVTFR